MEIEGTHDFIAISIGKAVICTITKLSIDNLLVTVYSIYMSATECQGKDTLKKRSRMRFVMQSNMGGT